jgi:hypothetical protein
LTFSSLPGSAAATVSIDLNESNATAIGNLKVIIFPGRLGSAGIPPAGNPVTVIWNHEQLRGTDNQLLTKLHLVASLPMDSVGHFPDLGSNPPTYSYTVQVLDDRPGPFNGLTIGTVTACSLTLNPSNPGQTDAPTVTLYGGTNNEAVPAQINFGHPITFVAKAVSNSASYKITRLGIKITEKLNANPLLNHNAGLGPGLYAPSEVMQPVGSSSGATFTYTPPILPPGEYQIDATAWDGAGYSRTVSKSLKVTRLFGFFSVTNIVRTPDTPDFCGGNQCNFPCQPKAFSAKLNLENHTTTASGPLRIRLLVVAGSAYEQRVFPPQLPPPKELTSASIGPVNPLPPGGVEHVQVSGVIPAPIQSDDKSGIGFQVYALLDTPSGLGVDSIKVTEGCWPFVQGFSGPGGGVTAPRPGIGGSSFDPYPKLLKNISTRCRVLMGDKVLIAGFIVKGSVGEKVIIRAIGPSLALPPSNIAGALADPVLELHKNVAGIDTIIATNDNWRSSQQAEIQATGIPPTNNLESAIVTTLQPYSDTNKVTYSAIVRGKNSGVGTALAEVYDIGQTVASQLVNISSRGFVGSGNDALIGGIIVGATGKVLARAIGPSLPNSILGRLQDPTLELRNSNGALVASNDNWRTNQAAIQATGAAPTNNNESAIVTTLVQGTYTIIVRGKNNGTGVGLVECYNVQ